MTQNYRFVLDFRETVCRQSSNSLKVSALHAPTLCLTSLAGCPLRNGTAPAPQPSPQQNVYTSSQYSDALTDLLILSIVGHLETVLYDQTVATVEEVTWAQVFWRIGHSECLLMLKKIDAHTARTFPVFGLTYFFQ